MMGPQLRRLIRENLRGIGVERDTFEYIVGVLSSDELIELARLAGGSVVLAHHGARGFDDHRRLADGVLALGIVFHPSLREPQICLETARRSYERCWRLLRPAWPLYQELADRLPEVVVECRARWDEALSRRARERPFLQRVDEVR